MEERAEYVSNELTFIEKDDGEKTFPPASYSNDEEWVQEYIRQFGEELSFF